MAWPSIAAPQRIKGKLIKKQHKSTMETGKVVSGAAWENSFHQFTLEWDVLSAADVALLESAFDSDLGGTFSWTHNVSSTVYTVGYQDDSIDIDANPNKIGYYFAKVTLEER